MKLKQEFRGQSYRWPSFIISCDGDKMPDTFTHVKLLRTVSGNLTKIEVLQGGEWHGIYCSLSGELSVSKKSTNTAILAVASSGSWSGGSNYSGYIFGKPGAVVWFNRKGYQRWLVFTDDGCSWQDVAPDTVPEEL